MNAEGLLSFFVFWILNIYLSLKQNMLINAWNMTKGQNYALLFVLGLTGEKWPGPGKKFKKMYKN